MTNKKIPSNHHGTLPGTNSGKGWKTNRGTKGRGFPSEFQDKVRENVEILILLFFSHSEDFDFILTFVYLCCSYRKVSRSHSTDIG